MPGAIEAHMAFVFSFSAVNDYKTGTTVSCNVPVYLPDVTTVKLYCLVIRTVEGEKLAEGVYAAVYGVT